LSLSAIKPTQTNDFGWYQNKSFALNLVELSFFGFKEPLDQKINV
jgi:hypothetical protein